MVDLQQKGVELLFERIERKCSRSSLQRSKRRLDPRGPYAQGPVTLKAKVFRLSTCGKQSAIKMQLTQPG
jgi:hypothetical protein